MKTHITNESGFLLNSCLRLLTACASLVLTSSVALAQSDEDLIETARSVIKTDRQTAVAEALQLTESEGGQFWPLYHRYRVEMDKVGDGVQKLVLDYADIYPDVPEERAKAMLKELLALEKKQGGVRADYLKKARKVLPASKALRFAQVESRLDLAVRLKLAANIPLVPVEGKLGGTSMETVAFTEGVPGGVVVETVRVRTTVVSIDAANRKVTLLDQDGFKQTVKFGSAAINFDQIQVGDELKLKVTEELVVLVADERTPTEAGEAGLVALAPRGAKPGGVIAETRRVAGTVEAVDTDKRTATLRFPDGSRKTFPVRRDVNLGRYKAGEQVVFQVTEMIAVEVEEN